MEFTSPYERELGADLALLAKKHILAQFPGLESFEKFSVDGPPDGRCNAFGWALGRRRGWIDGRAARLSGSRVSLEETADIFANLGGYERSGDNDETQEDFWEKVALFALEDGQSGAQTCVHAALQLADGRWSSKLGASWRITHSLRAVEGELCGRVAQILQRPR